MVEESETIIETYIKELFDANDPEVSQAPEGVGLKAHIGDLFTKENEDGSIERLFIQFYAQSNIPTKPKDPDLGYEIDDIIFEHGVVMADVEDRTDPPSYVGEIFSQEDFIDLFLDGSRLTDRVENMLDKLQDMVKPKEGWLENVSTLYNDRLPGKEGIVKPRRVC